MHDGFDFSLIFSQQFGGFGFEAHYQHWLRVGGSDQSPAFGENYAGSIDVVDLMRFPEVLQDFGHYFKFDFVFGVEADLGSRYELRESFGLGGEGTARFGYDVDQAAGGVGGVVETIVAVREEDVAGHFTR
jgi:hypothetical protein